MFFIDQAIGVEFAKENVESVACVVRDAAILFSLAPFDNRPRLMGDSGPPIALTTFEKFPTWFPTVYPVLSFEVSP